MIRDASWRGRLRRSLWGDPDYRNLWWSQTLGLFGAGITLLALPLVALLVLDASPFEIGLLWAVEYLPVLLLGLPAGVWVERLPARAVMIGADLVRAAAALAVPVALVFDALSLPLLYVVVFVIGVGTLFYDVAQLSALPALVADERLVDANGKLELSRSVAQIGGPAVGGVVVQSLTAPFAVVVNAVTYLWSALCISRVRRTDPPPRPAGPSSLRHEVVEGVRFVLGHRLMRPLLWCNILAELASAIILAMQVVYAVEVLQLSSAVIGVTFAIGNIGGVLGALVADPCERRFGAGRMFVVSIVLFTVGSAIIPLASGPVLFGFGFFIAYFGAFVFNVLLAGLCQSATPPHLLGRMNSVFRFASWGIIPLGAAGGGLLAQYIGLPGVFWLAAALNAVSLLPVLFSEVARLPGIARLSAERT